MVARLLRFYSSDAATIGQLKVGDHVFYTCEPPWRDNRQNISCIPNGEYRCNYLASSASGKFRRCYHVLDVPGRAGVLMHVGNFSAQTKGCLLPGLNYATKQVGAEMVLSSRVALDRLASIAGDQFNLVIIGGY